MKWFRHGAGPGLRWDLRWLLRLHRGRGGWGRSVLEGFQVVDDVVSNQSAAAESSPVDDRDAERRMKVLLLRQLLQSRGVGVGPKGKNQDINKKKKQIGFRNSSFLPISKKISQILKNSPKFL